jgi:hypothetical protein
VVLPAFFRWNGRGRRPEAIAEENGGGTPLEDPETVNPNMKPLKTTFSTLCIRLWVDHSVYIECSRVAYIGAA